ncbi:hypothetical protein F4808DRAFT_442187 [Astrocystis sublimbata]|nr:hypothetical protein F4808DRAFT_442187 [Astrocystis sublimbata]
MGWESELNAPNRAEFIVVIALLPVATLALVLRFLATRRTKRKLALEDYAAFGAWATLVLHDAAAFVSLKLTGSKDPVELAFNDPTAFEHGRKWTLAASVLYPTQQWFAKLSVAALYLRIFGVDTTYRNIIFGLIALQTAWWFIPFFIQIFACSPMEKFWMPFVEGTCISQGTIIAVQESVNSLLDFAFVILAMFMLQKLNISQATKAKLGVLFGLGALAGILGVVKIVITYSGDDFYAFAIVAAFSNVQMVVGIICSSVPVLTPLLPANGLWFRISSKFRKTYPSGGSTGPHASTSPRTDHSHSMKRKSQGGWQYIHEDNSSMRGLAWDQNTHRFETHAMADMSSTPVGPREPGIQVQRQVEVDHIV